MRILNITTPHELERAKKRCEELYDEIEGLADEMQLLQREEEDLLKDIEAYEEAVLRADVCEYGKLWRHVQECWQRFTWSESRIAERAAKGEELDKEETERLKLLCMQELGVIL